MPSEGAHVCSANLPSGCRTCVLGLPNVFEDSTILPQLIITADIWLDRFPASLESGLVKLTNIWRDPVCARPICPVGLPHMSALTELNVRSQQTHLQNPHTLQGPAIHLISTAQTNKHSNTTYRSERIHMANGHVPYQILTWPSPRWLQNLPLLLNHKGCQINKVEIFHFYLVVLL